MAQVNDFIDDRPSEAAQLLRMWADERQRAEQGAGTGDLVPPSDVELRVCPGRGARGPAPEAGTAAFRALTNRQKVAVVIAQMGPKRAVPILNELSDQDAIALATEVADLPELDDNTVIEVLGEFARKVASEPMAGGRPWSAKADWRWPASSWSTGSAPPGPTRSSPRSRPAGPWPPMPV